MPTDTLGRRSRFKRTPKQKHIVLGDRDIEILQYLYRYRYLRQAHLIAFLKPKSEKRFIERLGDLFHETGLINRPPVQWHQCDARSTPLIHEISKSGIALLQDADALPHRVTTLSRRSYRGRSPQFEHAMLIVDTLVETEMQTNAAVNQRFVPVDEILARAPEHTRDQPNPLRVPVTIRPCREFPMVRHVMDTHLIPDALYGIEHIVEDEKRYRFYSLECERTSPYWRADPCYSSTARKHLAYRTYIQERGFKRDWGIPNLELRVVR
ncbi:MAG: hypothetical protein AAFQ10_03890 [Pseudomonadota bacterium]